MQMDCSLSNCCRQTRTRVGFVGTLCEVRDPRQSRGPCSRIGRRPAEVWAGSEHVAPQIADEFGPGEESPDAVFAASWAVQELATEAWLLASSRSSPLSFTSSSRSSPPSSPSLSRQGAPRLQGPTGRRLPSLLHLPPSSARPSPPSFTSRRLSRRGGSDLLSLIVGLSSG